MLPAALCLLLFLQVPVNGEDTIYVTNGLTRGDWGFTDICPEGTQARGFRLKIEEDQGALDDSAMNGISLFCTKKDSEYVEREIKSTVGPFGSWKKNFFCKSGCLRSFKLRVEKDGSMGTTAANNIMFTCGDGQILEGDGMYWGRYGEWSGVCPSCICGIRTRVEQKQGIWHDDCALSDVQFVCCKS